MAPRIIFMGTPEFAQTVLAGLLAADFPLVAVVTQPDRPVGRSQVLNQSPVKRLALRHGLKVIQPARIMTTFEQLEALKPDLFITCAYGQFLPTRLLNLPALGCLNLHASLLPKLRGGAPIHHAIIQGETKTGISLMQMDAKMDAGPVALQASLPIDLTDTAGSLHDKLAALAADLIVKALPQYLAGELKFTPQVKELVTFAYNITKQDEFISFRRPYWQVYNQIRGLIPWPVGYAMLAGKRLKLHGVKFSEFTSLALSGTLLAAVDDEIAVVVENRVLLLTEVQFAGKQKISAQEFYQGQGKTLIGKRFE